MKAMALQDLQELETEDLELDIESKEILHD